MILRIVRIHHSIDTIAEVEVNNIRLHIRLHAGKRCATRVVQHYMESLEVINKMR